MTTAREDSEEHLQVFPVDRFREVKLIGEGRNATVFSAFDRDLRRRVALKLAAQDGLLIALDRERLDELGIEEGFTALVEETRAAQGRYTLLREARLLARIDHPNVVPVIDVGRLDDGSIAVVMPLLMGGSLADQALGERWRDVLGVALQIGDGLAAIHEAGILHRDLKPSNVLFDDHGRPRIADLGLACDLDDAEAMAERAGTGYYMAPELLRGRSSDRRDDLYAYCMLVFEMFYGHSPFASIEHRFKGAVSDIRRPGGMSAELREVLVRGLHPDPDARWPDMPTLLAAMRHTTRSRRAWVYVATTVAAALAIAALASMPTAEANACEEVTEELAQIWNDDTQAELELALGTRVAGDNLQSWTSRWVTVRANECDAARRDGRETTPSPCMAQMRDRLRATANAFQTPHTNDNLSFAAVIAELPPPEHCIAHPDDGDWAPGDLRDMDVEVSALVLMGDLDGARARERDYMELAREQSSDYGRSRALFWRAEIHRREGELDQAEVEFERVYQNAQRLGAPVLGAEAMMKLAAIAGARGNIEAMDVHAFAAWAVFEEREPNRVAEMLQIQGLALMSGSSAAQERGLELLNTAIEQRERQVRRYGGTHELLSQAHESYARGLLAVGRNVEALEYLDRALAVHQAEFGHGTWRVSRIQRQQFLGLLGLGRVREAEVVAYSLIRYHIDREDWRRLVADVKWLAEEYATAEQPHHATQVLRLGLDAISQAGVDDGRRELESQLRRVQQ
ncbi:Serine/threonine-protein kinase PknK [Enhygromyxa salina]|uniref:Serine/threonine-protein kinase PknK n=1 Tax=Enhygromyxa salina TaxID=215803 RepID=A0A2S9XJW4_9BACT|nr:serine/threonine-protein kinase [Enhygromyxa salina]PRP93143.1 Serine/threonine-protein kinase PknK [Enhygromyxa salina]